MSMEHTRLKCLHETSVSLPELTPKAWQNMRGQFALLPDMTQNVASPASQNPSFCEVCAQARSQVFASK